MSLLYFHLFLISSVILFSLGLGIWEAEHFIHSGAILDLLTAAGSFAAVLGFSYYLAWFIKKNKQRWKTGP